MLIPTLIMAIIAITLLIFAYTRGGDLHVLSLKSGWNILLQTLPMLIFAFIIAGTIQHVLPQELISKWIGDESGLRGIAIGAVAGGFMPGGPVTSLPIAAAIYKSGFFTAATGNRPAGLEIYPGAPGMHLFHAFCCRPASPIIVCKCSVKLTYQEDYKC
jgi:hypothetical protein